MAKRELSQNELDALPGARNLYGEESEQSKLKRGVKNYPDEVTNSPYSTAGVLRESRKGKKAALDRITGRNITPSRGADPEGNQDTLK